MTDEMALVASTPYESTYEEHLHVYILVGDPPNEWELR